MFTIKRVTNGDTSGFASEDWTISKRGGQTFLEACNYAKNPSHLEPQDLAPTLAELKQRSIEIQGTEEVATNLSYEVIGVTVIRAGNRHEQDLVLVGAAPGSRACEDAMGVLVTTRTNPENEQEVQYDFVYPGDQLYVTDRFGNTVESLR